MNEYIWIFVFTVQDVLVQKIILQIYLEDSGILQTKTFIPGGPTSLQDINFLDCLRIILWQYKSWIFAYVEFYAARRCRRI